MRSRIWSTGRWGALLKELEVEEAKYVAP